MKKDVHIYLPYNLANRLENIAKSEKNSLTDVYTRLLNQGLILEELLKNVKDTNINLKKITSNTNYIKSILRKIYSDVFNQNINDFDNTYLKKEKSLDE